MGYLFRKEGNEPVSYLFVGRPETNPVAVSIASFRGEILLFCDYSSAIVHDSRAHNQRLFIFGEVDRPELHWLWGYNVKDSLVQRTVCFHFHTNHVFTTTKTSLECFILAKAGRLLEYDILVLILRKGESTFREWYTTLSDYTWITLWLVWANIRGQLFEILPYVYYCLRLLLSDSDTNSWSS